MLLKTIEKQTKESKDAQDVYKLLQYLNCTNRVNFKQLKDADSISKSTQFQEFLIYNQDATREATFQKLKQKHGSIFTFHGSSIENWYSILRNGPRNLSNTKMMTAGAAYGAGVYSSCNFSTASGYCGNRGAVSTLGSGVSWKHSIVKGKNIIGILEIINKKEYDKNGKHNIVVCPDDHCIMLRYIWVFSFENQVNNQSIKDTSISLGFDKLYYDQVEKIRIEKLKQRKERLISANERARKRQEEDQLTKDKLAEQLKERDMEEESKKVDDKIDKLENKFMGKGSVTATKRILKEYKHFQTNSDLDNFEIKFQGGNNFYVWKLVLDILKFDLTPELREDFENLKSTQKKDPTLIFEITFPSSFPFDPPFIRVVQPIFKFHTGHVTIGGSLCMESLTPTGWSSARSIESLFIEILSVILQGGGQLDNSRIGHQYSIQEARSAFERVAKHHGWL